MIIVTMHFKGNMGKTMFAWNLIAPRIDGVVIPVESINADDREKGKTIRGEKYGQIMDGMFMVDNAVIDVGASNVEAFTRLMERYKGSHEIFDYFVIPAVVEALDSTISTIAYLADSGIPAEKILVVMNRITTEVDLNYDFAPLREYHNDRKAFTFIEEPISENEIYPRLKETRKSIADLLADETDYLGKVKLAKRPSDRIRYGQAYAMKCLAIGAQEELDNVFNAMFKSSAPTETA